MNDDLLRRLERLERRELARTAAASYAYAIDDGEPAQIAAIFHPEGSLTIPSATFRGRDAIAAFYASRNRGADRRHFITNVTVEDTDVDTQFALTAYFLFTGREPGRSALGWGVYDDLVDVAEGIPLLLSKSITPAVFTDLDSGWPA
ncbi:nuclear transport factor 2 family protein [uncultured Aeromicrobium sp.]|uniref:nuclear transport factor 2 family protein n=1 Tax=uncultured Aeromicrobium sp. TaxID=337820 RepID=UPI0025DDD4E3|nr:nuclear transport factor 2 family protein [uncultured Aeromicrobium sp.]